MKRIPVREYLPIGAEGFRIEVVERVLVEDTAIVRVGLLGDHPVHFARRASVVAFVASAICSAVGITVEIDRLVAARRLGNSDGDDRLVSADDLLHVVVAEQIDVALRPVVGDIEDVLNLTIWIGNSGNLELIAMLTHSKQNRSAMRIGKGRVGLPHASRQLLTREFAFYLHTLAA